MQHNQNQQTLKKRLYQNLLNKSPRHQYLLDNQSSKLGPILKPKVIQQTLNQTTKKPFTTFQKGKLLIQNQVNQIKSPQIPKKIAPINQNKQKLSKQAKAIIQEGKLKSKTNLKPHDIFAFYDAFPEMSEDFFYLNRMSHPYDYQIVTYSQRNQSQYMTISSKGVTLYHDKDAQFLTKQEWLADQKNYFMLQKIEFFKQYKICKNFMIWKNKMRRHYMKQMSTLLNQNLFLSSLHPRNCLLEIVKVTNNLKESLFFMPEDTIQSLDPQPFLKNVLRHIDTVFLPKMKNLQDIIAQELEKSIYQEIKKFKVENNIKIQQISSKDQSQSNKQGYVYSQQAILRKQYKKILKLIKLTDNLLLESKIELVHKCINQILQKIVQAKNNQLKQEWITCTAYTSHNQDHSFVQNQNKIYWNPDMESLKNIFRTIISQAVTKINQKYQKISSREQFQKYRINQQSQSRKDDRRSTIKFMIEDSQFFYPLLKKIEQYLTEEFKKCKKQESQLIKFIDIFTKHKSLPPIKQVFAKNSASELCQLVRQWKVDNLQMQELPDNKSLGLLVLNYAELRKKMILAPSQTLTSFLSILPQETSSKCRNLSHESKVLLDMINIYPIDILSFVSFNKCVKIATQKLDDLIDGGKEVIQMVSLIQQNKLANIDIYKGRSKEVMASIANLKTKVDQNNAKFDHSLSKFKKQIQTSTQKINSSIKDLISKFGMIPFDNLSSPIISTLQKIEQIMPTITSYQDQSNQIHQIQIQLNLNQTNFDQIHQLFQKAKIVQELWKCKKQWNQLLLSIYNKHFCQINCIQVKSKWDGFYLKSLQLQKKFSDSQVLKKMNLQILEFENLIDTISYLRSPNLQQKSWKQISQYLAYELSVQNQNQLPFNRKQNPQYTIEWLIKNNISLYKQKIAFIVQKSEKQRQLQQSLGQFKNFLSNLTIQTIIKKRQVPLLTENLNLKEELKEKISTLYSMIGNQYSQNIKLEAEILIKQFEYVEQILQCLHKFAKMWQKYQAFFQPNAISIKLLAKQSKQFTSWQLQWKKIIRNIISDPVYFYKKICDQTTGVNCSRAIIKAITKVNGLLDMIKKGVQQFLQKKRMQYPKYFFFSDQELLKILSKLDSRQLINRQIIPLVFDSIKFIEYQDESGTILSVTLKNQEHFPLIKQSNFKSQLQMEDLFKLTQQQIKKTMSQQIRTIFIKYIQEEVSRQNMIKQNNLQVSMCIDFITWVRLAEETYLTSDPLGSLQDWLSIQESQIKELHNLIRSSNKSQKFKAIQLMCQSIYFREKTESLTKKEIVLTEQYEWERIPKLMMSSSEIYLKQVNSKLNYCFELLLPQQIRMIFVQNQRNWINLISSISSKQAIGIKNRETLYDLSFYLGQNLKQYQISQNCHIKTVQKLLNAVIYTGCWAYIKNIQSLQILSYLASQISIIRKISLDFSNSGQITKSTSVIINPNSAFFLESGDLLISKKLIDISCYKSISCIKPNIKKEFEIYCECNSVSPIIGNRLVYIYEVCKDILKCGIFIDKRLLKKIFQKLLQVKFQNKSSEKQNIQTIDYLVLFILKTQINQYMDQSDVQLFQTLKNSLFANYSATHLKGKKILENMIYQKNQHPIIKYLQNNPNTSKFYNSQFIKSSIQLYDSLTQYTKAGTIITGAVLGGKSELIKFTSQIKKSYLMHSFQQLRLYHNAYQYCDLVRSCIVQKKQKERSEKNQSKIEKQKSQKGFGQIGILQKYLQGQAQQQWIVFDGTYNKQNFEKLWPNSPNFLMPIYGILKNQQQKKPSMNKVKLLLQTVQIQNSSPSFLSNFFILSVNEKSINLQSIVKKFFQQKKTIQYLKGLSQQSCEYMKSQLIFNLNKIQQKGNIKNKLIKMIYPLQDFQITFKCLTLISSVLRLNCQSIRQRQKNMKKIIDKFLFWSILTIVSLHVDPQHQQKAEKKTLEVLKCQSFFNQTIKHYIVYPGSGIQVNLISGLRTQSCLFQIPQNGIVTVVLKNDFNQFLNSSPKSSRFYEQVSLQDPSIVRVNTNQSNSFNYFSQLFSYSNTPIILTGPSGSGKKSILQLFAKNTKNKSQLYSIRFSNKKSLMDMYEKPFRKFNSLEGILLKSINANKNIVVTIQDMSLTNKQLQSIQFLRMLVNENSYLAKNGEKRSWTQANNTLCLTSCRIMIDKIISRFLSKTIIFQTSHNSNQKLLSIYSPYLSAWGKANSLNGESARIFCSNNGDSLLDSTLSVYKLMDQLYNKKKAEQNFQVQTILLRPKIGDISKILAFISRTPQAQNYSLQYYSQLWASQILRVFGDRFSDSKSSQYELLLKQIKKESLLKFKQNFIYNQQSSLIFTNMITENNRYYQKVQEIGTLQQFIINLIQSQAVTIPIKLLFNDLLLQILKIYRIIQIQNGHLMIFQLNKKARQYLVQLSCQIAQSNYISLKKRCLSVQSDILPILDLDENICVYQDVQDITQQQIYQLTCLLNKNYYDFNIKTQTKQKVKNRISKYLKNILAQIANRQQLPQKNTTQEMKGISNQTKLKSQTQKNQEQLFLNQKVQDQYETTMQQIFMSNTHFIFGANPHSSKTRKFLLNELDLIDNLHFNWFKISEQTEAKVSRQILSIQNEDQNHNKQNKQTKKNTQKILEKSIKIYRSQNENEKNFNDLFTLCQNVSEQLDKQHQKSNQTIQKLKNCIQNFSKSKQIIKQHLQKIQILQQQLQQIKKQQDYLTLQLQKKANQLSDLQLNIQQDDQKSQKEEILNRKNQEFQQIQAKLREIKSKKDKNDIQCRQSRKKIKISNDFLQIIGSIQSLNQKYEQQVKNKQIKEDSIIILWSLTLFCGKLSTQQLLKKAKEWKNLIESKIQCQFQNINQFLNFFEPYFNHFSSEILGWENLSQQIKMKGILFLFMMLHQQQLTQNNKIISVCDKWRVCCHLFQSIPIDSQLGQFNLGCILQNYTNPEFYQQIQKIKKGIIVLEEEIDQKDRKQIQKAISQRRIINFNRVISINNQSQLVDIVFDIDQTFLIKYLQNISLDLNQRYKLQQLKVLRAEKYKIAKKKHETQKIFNQKSAIIDLSSETNTQQLARLKQEVSQLIKKEQSLMNQINSQKWLPEDISLIKLITQTFMCLKFSDQNQDKNLNLVKKTYLLMKQIWEKTKYDLVNESKSLSKASDQNIQGNQVKTENKIQNVIDKIENQIIEQKILKKIEIVLKNNFSREVSGDIMNLGLQSLNLVQKVPIILVQNNLQNLKLIPKQIKPTCLYSSNLSNLLLQISDQVKQTHKIITFYNDEIHLQTLMEIVQKYLEDWILNHGSRNYNIILFTNSSIKKLEEKELQNKKIKLFYYKSKALQEDFSHQKQQINTQNLNLNNSILNLRNSQQTQKKQNIQVKIIFDKYLKINAKILQKAKVTKQEEEELKKLASQINLTNQSQVIQFLKDHTDKLQQESEIICKLIKNQISQKQLQILLDKKQLKKQHKVQYQRKSIILNSVANERLNSKVTIQQINQISQELPFAFNITQFSENITGKDPLVYDLEKMTLKFNNKLKKIKHNLKNILDQYTLKTSKTYFFPFSLPTQQMINQLNRQYKILKKCLSCLNIINLPPQSTIKIGSSKGIGSQADIDSLIIKNSVSMSYLPFNKRIYNQIMFRACKKLKIPLCRLGVEWVIIKNNSPLISNGLNVVPQICINLVGRVKYQCQQFVKSMNGNLLTSCQGLFKNNSLSQIKILMIPYDIGASQKENSNALVKEINLKKQSSHIEKQKQGQKEKEKVQGIINKLKISIQISQTSQIIGFVQIPLAEISDDISDLRIRKPVILI